MKDILADRSGKLAVDGIGGPGTLLSEEAISILSLFPDVVFEVSDDALPLRVSPGHQNLYGVTIEPSQPGKILAPLGFMAEFCEEEPGFLTGTWFAWGIDILPAGLE